MQNEIEVPQDLVEAMIRAYKDTPFIGCRGIPDPDGMAAALRVVLEDERVLGNLTDNEKREYDDVKMDLKAFVANRRARLLKPKTPEERVTLRAHTSLETFVCLDGEPRTCVPNGAAEWTRLGLIAKLKAEQEAQS